MSIFSIILTFALPILALVFSVIAGIKVMNKTHSGKKAFVRHFVVLAVSVCLAFAFTCIVSATDGGATAVETGKTIANEAAAATDFSFGMRFIGASLSIGLAAIGAGIALAAGAPAAIGAVAEDPKSFGKSLIFVALGEAVAIYGLIISFLIIIPTL
ncbi:MAG: ATP synthase subunit C [Oscillospiraceae bacterium]